MTCLSHPSTPNRTTPVVHTLATVCIDSAQWGLTHEPVPAAATEQLADYNACTSALRTVLSAGQQFICQQGARAKNESSTTSPGRLFITVTQTIYSCQNISASKSKSHPPPATTRQQRVSAAAHVRPLSTVSTVSTAPIPAEHQLQAL